jgi:hypothetical protein
MSKPANHRHAPAVETGACTCPLCATDRISDGGYFTRSYSDAELRAASSEAITETLGFCARHGAILLAQKHLSGEFLRMLHAAIPRLLLLLHEQHLQKHAVQQILFGTDGACPACSHANRAAGRQAAHLARQIFKTGGTDAPELERTHALCIRHFRMFEAHLAFEPRQAALDSYTAHLAQISRDMKALLRSMHETSNRAEGDAAAVLHDALGLVAGRSATGAVPPADTALQYPALAETIALPQVCPLCAEAERARQRWLHKVQRSTGFDEDAWLILPTCPEHIAALARLGEPGLTTAAVSRALDIAVRHHHKQMQTLAAIARQREEEARIKAEGPEVWAAYKRKQTYRKRKQQNTENPAAPLIRMARCPACEWDEIALERTTGELIDLLHEKQHRSAYGRGYGLCLKHYARVHLIAPKGAIRSLLADDMQRRLAGLAHSLGELERKTSVRPDAALLILLQRLGGSA